MAVCYASTRARLFDRRAWVLALASLALAGCWSNPPQPEEGTNPPLFEIVNANGEIEGWMLGTIHALPDNVGWRTGEIERVIEGADLLVVEVADMEDQQKIADTVAELAISDGLPALPQRVAPSLRPTLLDVVGRSGVTLDKLSGTETWAAALALARVEAQGDPKNGVDRAVIGEFDNREVIEFEGVVGQLTIFDSLAEEDQRDLLEGVLEESQLARDNPGRLRRAWLKGDLGALEQATSTGIMADEELREALLVKRNRSWIGKLSGLLRDPEKPLVAVGAAHLVGEDGLPALLEERGYSVRRMGR